MVFSQTRMWLLLAFLREVHWVLSYAFLSFALLSLNFNDPVPSYSAICSLVHLSSLQDRRTTSALVFICDLLSSKIDCPAFLSSIGFSVPGRSLRSFEPFFIPAYRAYYAFNEPLCRALFYWNKLPSHMRLDPCSPRELIKKPFTITFRPLVFSLVIDK